MASREFFTTDKALATILSEMTVEDYGVDRMAQGRNGEILSSEDKSHGEIYEALTRSNQDDTSSFEDDHHLDRETNAADLAREFLSSSQNSVAEESATEGDVPEARYL